MFIKALTFFLVFLFSISIALANPFIIEVVGNQRVETNTILNQIDTHKLSHSTNTVQEINIAKQQLIVLDLFSNINIFLQQNKIIIEVQENQFITEIKFIGNSKLSDEILNNELILKKKTIFSINKLKQDLKNIQQIYLKTGKFLAHIQPKMVIQEHNKAELIFEIDEGPKANIKNIYFTGNKAFSKNDLAEQISTKKTLWWKFLSTSDIYDPDKLQYDKDLLTRFYYSKGYADFIIIEATAEINQLHNQFFINFLLEEGEIYHLKNIEIVNQIPNFDASILQKIIKFKENDIYNANLIEETITQMSEILSQNSYAFTNIEPIIKKDSKNHQINLQFLLNETPRIYIDQINITGNTRTINEVILRELRIKEGDPYNTIKLNRSKQRLENLGFFEKVDFNIQRINNTDKVILQIKVKEKKTGELNLGLGYSTVNKFNINTGIKENNLFGTGRQIGINLQKSFTTVNAEFNYTKPYFFNHPIDVGFDLFKYRINKRNSLVYDQNNSGFKINANYSITEFLTHQVTYNRTNQNIGNIDTNSSFAIRNLQGNFVYSGIEHSFLYDKRNNRIDPKSGYFFSLLQAYNGLGGNIKTLKHEFFAGYYQPTFNQDLIFKLLFKTGVIDGLGQAVLSNNNFFLGGDNFRGFEYAGIGPRTYLNGSPKNGEAVGGKIYYIGTAEFRFPLGLPKELGIYGSLFSDNGVLKQTDIHSTPIANSGNFRSSYGLSFAWASPMGPIRLDFAKILRKASYDQVQNFRFSIGTSF
jgi:outer membrane protein insertion porin family